VTGTAPDLFGIPASAPEPPIGPPPKGRRAGRRHGTNPSRRKRWVILAGGVVVVLGAAGGGFWATRGSSAATPTYQLVAAESSTLRQTVSSTGTIEPAQQANLNFAASGQVTSVAVTVGQKVKAGQVLATVNSASLAANVAQAKATEASDSAKLSADEAAGSGVTSAQLTADEDAVTAAETQVTDAEQALAEAKLTSPINGVVAALNLSVDQQVSGAGSSGAGSSGGGSSGGGNSGAGGSGASSANAGSAGASSTGSSGSGSSGSSNAQVVVISTTSYLVNGTVDDTEVGSVQAGDQAVIIPDGATTPVYGTVSSVGLIADTTSGVATYPVTIAVTATTGTADLLPGAAGAVYFTLHNTDSSGATFDQVAPGATVVSDNTGLCASSYVSIAQTLPYTIPTAMTVSPGATSGVQSIASLVKLASNAPGMCQGVTFTVTLTLSGKSS